MRTYINDGRIEIVEGQDSISFFEGRLSALTHSYCIDSFGDIDLSEDSTRELYEFMRSYYETK